MQNSDLCAEFPPDSLSVWDLIIGEQVFYGINAIFIDHNYKQNVQLLF